jgi:hypothetical protein
MVGEAAVSSSRFRLIAGRRVDLGSRPRKWVGNRELLPGTDACALSGRPPPDEPTTSDGALTSWALLPWDGLNYARAASGARSVMSVQPTSKTVPTVPNPFSPGISERPSRRASLANPRDGPRRVRLPRYQSREARPPGRCVSTCGRLVYQYEGTRSILWRQILVWCHLADSWRGVSAHRVARGAPASPLDDALKCRRFRLFARSPPAARRSAGRARRGPP